MFLDTAGAFDNVRPNGLFIKLKNFGIHGRFLRMLINSYTGLTGHIIVNGILSESFKIQQSIRQGGIL
jgi:hypothetical protein